MYRKRAVLGFAWAVAVTLLCAGCGGGSAPEAVKVSGLVTYNGAPLQNATVTFFQEDTINANSGTGRTNESGEYILFVRPGDYKVIVSKDPIAEKAMAAAETDPDANPKGVMTIYTEAGAVDPSRVLEGQITELIPEKYSHPQKTELTFSVPSEGTDSANFTNLTGST